MAKYGQVLTLLLMVLATAESAWGQGATPGGPTSEQVLRAIDRGKKFLIDQQRADGSWMVTEGPDYKVGVTSLAVMALINSGMTPDDDAVARGLKWLRAAPEPPRTYESSLMIMALAAAKNPQRDTARLISLVQQLEGSQIKAGEDSGTWGYASGAVTGDRSNAQYAVLGLREAQYAGVQVSRTTWERAHEHWRTQQASDGGWNYAGPGNSTSIGSMTVAGIASMVITQSMLRQGDDELVDGTPICCGNPPAEDNLDRAISWMGRNFSVRSNPQYSMWYLYYMYGLERAGRLSGQRMFGQHDWYRRGAEYLIAGQTARGSWQGEGPLESDPVLGTSFVLLFLSKGLAPVLVNKLEWGENSGWDSHLDDVRNLTEHISALPDWPKLLTWQQVELKAATAGGVESLMQAPVLFLNGSAAPDFSEAEVKLLRDFVQQGGFLLANASCGKSEFDQGFRKLITQMFPEGEPKLLRLSGEHPVFRAEYPLDPDTTEIWGVDVGCRTSIMYLPQDAACLWDKWTPAETPNRSPALKAQIIKANKIGVNIIAYATGREPFNKLDQPDVVVADAAEDQVQRGLLQIAKIRHSGGWDSAPQALRNLLAALNDYAGTAAATQPRNLAASDPNLFKYPLAYMHGRNRFQMGAAERDKLRQYLDNGGVLFADSCCGSTQFDSSFRDLMAQLYPDQKFTRIPATHEMFTQEIGHDVRRVRRRSPESDTGTDAIKTQVVEGEPFLEGIEVDGRWVVLYSKYDISCALERQASSICSGYVYEDAVKLAVNMVLYALEP